MKHKGLIIFGVFVLAAIIGWGIYKAIGNSKDVAIISQGGSHTVSSGLSHVLESLKGILSGFHISAV